MTLAERWQQFVTMVRGLITGGNSPALSAYASVYALLVRRLRQRTDVPVGSTASVPRVEVHTFTEQARQDKGGRVRQLSCIVETIHNSSFEETAIIADENLALLTSGLPTEGTDEVAVTRIFAVVPEQRQDLTETSDTQKIIYRVLDTITVWVEEYPVEQ